MLLLRYFGTFIQRFRHVLSSALGCSYGTQALSSSVVIDMSSAQHLLFSLSGEGEAGEQELS